MQSDNGEKKGTEPCCGGCEEQDGSCRDEAKGGCCQESPKGAGTGASCCGGSSGCGCDAPTGGGSKLKSLVFLIVILAAIVVGAWALRSDKGSGAGDKGSACCPAGASSGSGQPGSTAATSDCCAGKSEKKGEKAVECPERTGSTSTPPSSPTSGSAGIVRTPTPAGGR
jgi:hypothetical protein